MADGPNRDDEPRRKCETCGELLERLAVPCKDLRWRCGVCAAVEVHGIRSGKLFEVYERERKEREQRTLDSFKRGLS